MTPHSNARRHTRNNYIQNWMLFFSTLRMTLPNNRDIQEDIEGW